MNSLCNGFIGRAFPFAALVGQEQMKLALLLNAVNPVLGGVLIRGEKGTAKSTAARGLASLLPEIETFADCGYQCEPEGAERCPVCRTRTGQPSVQRRRPPFVSLPLGATEDCLVGSVDFEAAVRFGEARFRPGLLARAHRGVLYVDEVNLLDDHLVDSLLDTAESGVNLVEREGMSVWHSARFLLVGTMNPEEGELRAQLLDRFALVVEVKAEREADIRVELLRRREQFDASPTGFIGGYAEATLQLAARIEAARRLVKRCAVPKQILGFIAEICRRNQVAGHRADIVIERAACAYAALGGHSQVSSDDVLAVAPLALLHRMRTGQPLRLLPPPDVKSQQPEGSEEKEEKQPQQQQTSEASPDNENPSQSSPTAGRENSEQDSLEGSGIEQVESQPSACESTPPGPPPDATATSSHDEQYAIGPPFAAKTILPRPDRRPRTGSGRRTRSRSASKQGRYVKSSPTRSNHDLALDATLRAAAPFQVYRRQQSDRGLAILIEEQDIRMKIRERRIGTSLLFVVDGSGSMGAERRMVETKAAIMSLLMDAYQKRDKVGLIVFRQQAAELLLDFTGSIECAARWLTYLPVGGRTPLSAGLVRTAEALQRLHRKDSGAQPLVLILTDGRANVGLGALPPHREALALGQALAERFAQSRFVIVDTESKGAVRLELAKRLATAMMADYFRPEDLRAEALVQLARAPAMCGDLTRVLGGYSDT
ncbi:magnesium chelatase subunit D family protein [Myxococcota bacterium]